ncbi:MAG TPA: nuclear transport factor 2 family protein [Thermoleophilaceae bacterium]|nr:nuclear transport factor 2 family protein [Thermoleophilaceae bacterium]
MTRSRLDLLRAAYDAYNRGEVASVAGFASEDIEVCPPPTSLDPAPFRGRDALLQYLEPDLFEFQRAEPAEFLEEEDRILVAVKVHARGRGGGVELHDEAFHVWTVEGERAVRFEVFVDRDEALAALRR